MTLTDDLAILKHVAAQYDSDHCTAVNCFWWWDEDACGRPIKRCEICDRWQSPEDAQREHEDAMSERADATIKEAT